MSLVTLKEREPLKINDTYSAIDSSYIHSIIKDFASLQLIYIRNNGNNEDVVPEIISTWTLKVSVLETGGTEKRNVAALSPNPDLLLSYVTVSYLECLAFIGAYLHSGAAVGAMKTFNQFELDCEPFFCLLVVVRTKYSNNCASHKELDSTSCHHSFLFLNVTSVHCVCVSSVFELNGCREVSRCGRDNSSCIVCATKRQ